MLVLKRRRGETLIIGGDVTIRVLQVRGSQVTLGIKAPKATAVHRQEVYESIQRGEPRGQVG